MIELFPRMKESFHLSGLNNVQWCANTSVNGTKARGNWIVPPQGQKIKKEKWSGEQRKQESKEVEEERRGEAERQWQV